MTFNLFGDKGLKKYQHFKNAFELNKNDYHPTGKGIYYRDGEATQSILVTNKYERDRYDEEKGVLYYEGSYFQPDNTALEKNLNENIPVRVFVSSRSKLSIAPQNGVMFVGLYRVIGKTYQSGSGSTKRIVFHLVSL